MNNNNEIALDLNQITSFYKIRSFVFQSSEIHGGFSFIGDKMM